VSGGRSLTRSLTAQALQLYAQYVPFHRGKQRLVEHLTARLGLSLSGERVVKRQGLWWSLDPADYVCQDLFWCGAKDVAQLRAVREHMTRGGVMFDIGASFGYYSLMIARAFRQRCTIHAFEPSGAAFARLTANLQRNSIGCVQAHRIGVWDTETSAQVRRFAGNSGSAYLMPGGDVPVIPLDEFCLRHDIRRVDLIKLDVEGSEYRVLRGAARTLAAHRPAILMELNPTALTRAGTSVAALLALVAGYGYTVRPATFRGRVDIHDLGDTCTDVICTQMPGRNPG
jgi:FkbM family methyltransferase